MDERRAGDRNRLLVHPAAARFVLGVLRAPATGRDITRTVMTDPALVAAVMRAANSAHLGYSRRIASFRQAAVMLGGSLISSLAASRVADLVFDADAPDYPEWLWLHSLAMGCCCSVLARHTGDAVDEGFTVGVLHDVGWLLAASNGVDVAANDTDHAAAGADLLARWNLPERIVSAVQHDHARATTLHAPLDRLVVAAHGIVGAMGVPSPERTLSSREALALVNLSNVRPSLIVDQVETELAALTGELTASA
jgi:HD-like signal output (HDOD) protein